jgi:hypothetical protein
MRHFNCDFNVQNISLHKNWYISFLLIAESEILYIIIIIIIIQQAVQSVHILLLPFIYYTIFPLKLCLSINYSSNKPFSPISPLIPFAQVSLGFPRWLLPAGRLFIACFGNLPLPLFEHVHTIEVALF